MTVAQLDRLMKLMMLTQSDNDNEALLALRKANEMLKAEKMNWADVFQMIRSTTQLSIEEYTKQCNDSFFAAFGIRPYSVGGMTRWNERATPDTPQTRTSWVSEFFGKQDEVNQRPEDH